MSVLTGGLRRVLLLLLGLVAGVVVLATAALVFVMTPPGERWAKDYALKVANERWRGHLAIADLDYALDELELREVRVEDPDGAEVLSIRRLYVDVDIWDLLRQVGHIERVELDGYRLNLRQHPDGAWNLARALELVEPSKVEQDVGETLPVFVDALVIRGGVVDARLADRAQSLRLEGMDWQGALSYQNELLRGRLDADAELVHPRKEPLQLTAMAEVQGGRQLAEVDLSAGGVSLGGSVTLPKREGRDSWHVRELDAALRFSWPEFDVLGYQYGPFELDARLRSGTLVVDQLWFELPGLTLSNHPQEVGVALQLRADALEKTAQSLTALVGVELPPMAGAGQLTAHLTDPLDLANLELEGSFSELRLAALQVSNVDLQASLANLTEPTRGELELSIGELSSAGPSSGEPGSGEASQAAVRFEGLSLRVETRERGLELAAALSAPHAVQVDLGGRFDASYEELAIQQLAIGYPENRWTLESEAALVRWADERLVVRDLKLAADGQRVAIEVDHGARRQHAELRVSQFRLESIPEAWWPIAARPGGTIEARVRGQGSPDDPVVNFEVTASQLRWRNVQGLEMKLDGEYRAARVSGSAGLEGFGGTLAAQFDLPTSYPPVPGAPLKLQASTGELELDRLWRAAVHLVPAETVKPIQHVAGSLQLTLNASGSWPEPVVRVEAELWQGVLEWEGAGRYHDIALRLEGSPERIRMEEASAATRDGSLRASGEAKGTGEAWAYRYEVSADAKRFLVPLDDPLLVTTQLRLSGQAALERVTSRVVIDGLELRRRAPDGQPERSQARLAGALSQ